MTFVSNMLSFYVITTQTAIYNDQRGITKIHKDYGSYPLHVVLFCFYICMLFHQDILKGFQIIERTLFCNGIATRSQHVSVESSSLFHHSIYL